MLAKIQTLFVQNKIDQFCSSNWASPSYKCFKGGEYRTSENIALVGVQTLFLREHNRVASQLAKLNPKWNDETLYQEARRIVIAEIQHITFNEYVPMISGNNTLNPLNTLSYYTGYNPNVK
jgi:peroxidase